jgi:hypothetical protein
VYGEAHNVEVAAADARHKRRGGALDAIRAGLAKWLTYTPNGGGKGRSVGRTVERSHGRRGECVIGGAGVNRTARPVPCRNCYSLNVTVK